MKSKYFIFGAIVGAVASYLFTKKHLELYYKRLADEEIASVKEVFGKPYEHEEHGYTEEYHNDLKRNAKEKVEYRERYNRDIEDMGYTHISPDKIPPRDETKPFVISPDDFGQVDDYEQISLYYTADKVLTDENNEVVDNLEMLIGHENVLLSFGQYERDSVYVRNHDMRTDYEILAVLNHYHDPETIDYYKGENANE